MTPRAETLTPADRAQLVQILDRLGSDNELLRAAAVWLANEFLCDRGLTWAELIIRRAPTPPAPADWQRRSDNELLRAAAVWLANDFLRDRGLTWAELIIRRAPTPPAPSDWQRRADWCAERSALLTPWDQSFLASMAGLPHPPTPKQTRIIERLVARRMAAEEGGA